jgi:hypothetical protein
MDKVFLLDWISRTAQGIQCGLHIHRMPDNHRIRQQIEARCLVALALLIFLCHHALTCKEEKFPQIMQFLAFVELGTNTLAQGVIVKVTQDEKRLDKPPILLKEFR